MFGVSHKPCSGHSKCFQEHANITIEELFGQHSNSTQTNTAHQFEHTIKDGGSSIIL